MLVSCTNSRIIRRVEIEERVVVGLREKPMEPEAMKVHTVEPNRLNRERCASGATDRKELADIEKKTATMIAVIEEGGYARGMMDAALHGDLGTILDWAGNGRAKETTGTPGLGMSVSVVAKAGFEPATFRL